MVPGIIRIDQYLGGRPVLTTPTSAFSISKIISRAPSSHSPRKISSPSGSSSPIRSWQPSTGERAALYAGVEPS